MNTAEQTPGAKLPLPPAVLIAAACCFVSLACFYLAAHSLVERLQVQWAEWLIYASIPIAVTFAYLRHSRWHQEIIGIKRTGSALLVSCLIFTVVAAMIAVMACLVWIVSISVPIGVGGH